MKGEEMTGRVGRMDGMGDLTEFLLARIAEDEAVAREALHSDAVRPGEWVTEHHGSEYHSEPDRCHIAEDRSGHYWSVAHEVFIPNAEHIARHDPARVLAECEAKRRIVEAYREERARRDIYQADEARAVEDDDQATRRRSSAARCRGLEIAVELLAEPYADHPSYREEWKP